MRLPVPPIFRFGLEMKFTEGVSVTFLQEIVIRFMIPAVDAGTCLLYWAYIIADVPYGNLAVWEGNTGDSLHAMYAQLYKIAHKDTILAVIMDKKQKYAGDIWIRLEKQTIGKRKFEIYRKAI